MDDLTARCLTLVALLTGMILIACGGSGGLSGKIDIDGSSTVFPITQGVAEEFSRENRGVHITVGQSGTGGGFSKFCSGGIEINDASRQIKESEIEQCAENGIEWTEFEVAIDGLSVATNNENDWVTCLTVDQLNAMWKPDSPISRWSDLDPDWPDEEIQFFSPGTDSGTFDYFTDTINGHEGAVRTDSITFSEDDNVLVVGVEGNTYATGYFGYAYYRENTDRIQVLQIDGGEGCVIPDEQTVRDGTYSPLSRPLFIYVNNDALANKQDVAEFVRFYFSDGRIVIPEVGYVELPESAYQENLNLIDEITRRNE